MCPQNKKRGRIAPISKPTNEWDPIRQQTLSQRGWVKGGGGGASPLPGGLGDVPPKIQKKGRVAPISNPATSGTQNASKPKANGGG